MPTVATASVVGHLYAPPEIKQNDKGPYALIRFWTKDRFKVKGQEESRFTSWEGFVNGPQAEWLKDGKKGSLVFASGSIRLDSFTKSDGTASHRIAFTRISECRLLERDDAPAGDATPRQAAPTPIKPSTGGSMAAADDVPFMRLSEWG